ncbi:hypothetical protein HKBW3S42_01957, partial [Candidatus Hakubella thermalkaliphila]
VESCGSLSVHRRELPLLYRIVDTELDLADA